MLVEQIAAMVSQGITKLNIFGNQGINISFSLGESIGVLSGQAKSSVCCTEFATWSTGRSPGMELPQGSGLLIGEREASRMSHTAKE